MQSDSLSHNLAQLLASAEKKDLSLEEIFKQVGDKGFGLLMLILSLPSALPVPAPGYSTPFGILLFCLGLQMLLSKPVPWLPQWARRMTIKQRLAQKMIKAAIAFFSKVEHLIKPRLHWISSRLGLPVMGLLVIIMSLLMILPIPLTNTAPAMVIFLIGVGLCEDDGLFAGGACLLGILAVLLYAGVIFLFIQLYQNYGSEAGEKLKELIKEKLKSLSS